MEKEKVRINNKNIIVILIAVSFFILCFAIINRSSDGELNDYEKYEPVVEVNESDSSSDSTMGNAEDFAMSMITVLLVVGFVIATVSFVLPIFRMEDYC